MCLKLPAALVLPALLLLAGEGPKREAINSRVRDSGVKQSVTSDRPQNAMNGQNVLRSQKVMPQTPPAAAGQVFPYRAVHQTLPNGLKTIVIPLDSPGLVTYWSVVRTGSRDEVEPGRSGFAHFFEHMMFRGTPKYPGPVYDQIVTSLGADSNAYTTDDYTAYHMTFAKEDLERVVEIESDRFQNLSYEKPAFQTEAGAVYGEYRKSITHPFSLLDEKLRDLAYTSYRRM